MRRKAQLISPLIIIPMSESGHKEPHRHVRLDGSFSRKQPSRHLTGCSSQGLGMTAMPLRGATSASARFRQRLWFVPVS